MSKHPQLFTLPIRVYFQDTDAGGVVYHGSYLNYMERSRTEWMRSFGSDCAGLITELGMGFVVRSVKLDYLKPALLDDLLDVSTQILGLGRSRVTLRQTVFRGEDTLVDAELNMVCVTLENFKPVSVPDELREQWKPLVTE